MGERLTKRVVDAATPTGRDTFLFDSDIKGFALKITAGGKKVFTYQGRVAGEKVRVTIGPYGAFTCDQARAEAEKLRAMFARGIRPSDLEKAAQADAEQRRKDDEALQYRAFSAVAERYFVVRVRKQARGKPVEALIRNVFVGRWQDRDIATIARRDLVAVLDELVADNRPGAAREALKRIRPLFAFAVEKEDIGANPAEGTRAQDRVGDLGALRRATLIKRRDALPCGSASRLRWRVEVSLSGLMISENCNGTYPTLSRIFGT